VSEALVAVIFDALLPSLRRIVREEVARAELQWRWRTPKEAGALLGISEQAVRQRVLRGQLPGERYQGRVYIDIRNLDALIGNGRYDGPDFTSIPMGRHR
jgi:hypothetical protein